MNVNKENRKELRKNPDTSDKVTVEIILSYPKGLKIVKEISDISEHGLSFKMSDDEGYFLPGTPIKEMYISDGSKRYLAVGEVIYVKSFEEEKSNFFRIGVCFSSKSKLGISFRKGVNAYNLRPQRYDANEIKNTSKFACFTDPHGNKLTSKIINFSKYGAAFELNDKEFIFRNSATIEDLQLIVGNEVVYSGKATVVKIRELNDRTIVGISFLQTWLDVDRILNLKNTADLENDLSSFITSLSSFNKVDPNFKIAIADLRQFLDGLKEKLDSEEQRIRSKNFEHRKILENQILETVERLVVNNLKYALSTINNIVSELPPDAHLIHKKYFQRFLQPLWMKAPFVKRAFTKPLGYAGDYEMINIIFRAAFEGDCLFGKLLNHFCCGLPPAQAHQARTSYLLTKIDNYIKKETDNQRKTIRLLSIGCGPAKEIQELIKINRGDNLEVTLLDFDSEALYYCQERILELKVLTNSNIKVNFINKTVRQLIKESIKNSSILKQDIIYCMGLFDYLTAPVCQKLTSILYESLTDDGNLIISNIDAINEFQYPMEYGCEWYLFHRTKEELRDFASRIQAQTILTESDKTGLNNFLFIQR